MERLKQIIDFETKLQQLVLDFEKFKQFKEKDVLSLAEFVLNTISKNEGYSVKDIVQRSRKAEYVTCRYMYYSILLDITAMSPKSIGSTIGYDRVTVLYAKDRMQELFDTKDKSVINYEKYKQAAINYRDSLANKERSADTKVARKI